MSLHIEAKRGEIAETVLITGDPLRAKHYAETMITAARCYNRIRGMLGYSGTFLGKPVSIQGTGIGIPSTALYIHELIHAYGVKCIIRLGTCGAIQKDIRLGQLLLANKALTDSRVTPTIARDYSIESTADLALLQKAQEAAQVSGLALRTGTVFSTDLFYSDDDATRWIAPARQGVLAVEMETSVLYALATKNNVAALSILTVSDNILTGAVASAEERETQTLDMVRLALKII